MPANTQTTRRPTGGTAATTDPREDLAAPSGDEDDQRGDDAPPASANAPATFADSSIVLPNLFDRDNALVPPDTRTVGTETSQ